MLAAVAVAVEAVAEAVHPTTNARLVLRARDALNPRLNVRRCRIIHVQKILMLHDR
jgi:prophage DNA circulation protein